MEEVGYEMFLEGDSLNNCWVYRQRGKNIPIFFLLWNLSP